jgi:hypothetical protein
VGSTSKRDIGREKCPPVTKGKWSKKGKKQQKKEMDGRRFGLDEHFIVVFFSF